VTYVYDDVTQAKLGLKQVPTVLVMGGGDGVGPMQAIAQNVGKRLGGMCSVECVLYRMCSL